MKIVHILPSLARGGGERLVIELANRQASAGHEVDLLIGQWLPDPVVHDPPDGSVRLQWIAKQPSPKLALYRAGLNWVWRHRKWLGSRDIIHAHLTYGAVVASVARRLVSRATRPAFVETYHAVGMPIPSFHRWLHSRLASERDAVGLMVDDPYWTGFARHHPHVLTKVIPVGIEAPDVQGVSPQIRRNYREALGIPPGATVVGTVSRLAPARRTDLFVAIYARIAQELGDGAHFIIGGDGPERRKVEQAIEAAGLRSRIHLTGTVQDQATVYAIMDAYITSNVGPICGVAGLQAIAAGLPTVALQLREDYVGGEGDWIWSSTDTAAVGREAARLIRFPDEADALRQRQGTYFAAQHSGSAMAEQYEQLYLNALVT